MKHSYLKAIRIIEDPDDCSSDGWNSTVTQLIRMSALFMMIRMKKYWVERKITAARRQR